MSLPRRSPHRPRGRGGIALAVTSLIVALLLTVSTAAAADAEQAWIGQPDGDNPDIELHLAGEGIVVFDTAGNALPIGVAGSLNFSLTTDETINLVGLCVDTATPFDLSGDPVPVEVTTSTPSAGSDDAALAWIIVNRLPASGDPTDPGLQRQAAVAQLAAWVLMGEVQSLESGGPTSNSGLNDEVSSLIDEARAATANPLSLDLSITPRAPATLRRC